MDQFTHYISETENFGLGPKLPLGKHFLDISPVPVFSSGSGGGGGGGGVMVLLGPCMMQ